MRVVRHVLAPAAIAATVTATGWLVRHVAASPSDDRSRIEDRARAAERPAEARPIPASVGVGMEVRVPAGEAAVPVDPVVRDPDGR